MSAVETGKLYHGLSSAGGGEFHLLSGLFDEGLETGAAIYRKFVSIFPLPDQVIDLLIPKQFSRQTFSPSFAERLI